MCKLPRFSHANKDFTRFDLIELSRDGLTVVHCIQFNENQYRNHSLTSPESDHQSHLAIHYCHHSLGIEEYEKLKNFQKLNFSNAYI